MNFRNFEAEEKLFVCKALLAFALVLICFTILVLNLYRFQVRDHGYYQTRSNQNDMKMIPIAPTRGLIFDRDGVPLVHNVTWYDIMLTPYKIEDMQATLKALTQSSRYKPVVLKEEMTDEQVARFSVNKYRFTGVTIDTCQDREYPYGADLAHAHQGKNLPLINCVT
ncbi:hypothetical protein [Candidatus Pantoea persica]|uniref:hypothetical protein n=1 Tax=Candidatus Pantoea persica TaxID=2518128 RepID=UPI0035A90E53|nr:Purine nucleoside phosphorylase DeoD-type [Candidatus Pantoea persica]